MASRGLSWGTTADGGVEHRREKGGGLIGVKSSFRRAFNGSWMENLTMSYNELKLNSVSNRKCKKFKV